MREPERAKKKKKFVLLTRNGRSMGQTASRKGWCRRPFLSALSPCPLRPLPCSQIMRLFSFAFFAHAAYLFFAIPDQRRNTQRKMKVTSGEEASVVMRTRVHVCVCVCVCACARQAPFLYCLYSQICYSSSCIRLYIFYEYIYIYYYKPRNRTLSFSLIQVVRKKNL
jgi:hypothetical protein